MDIEELRAVQTRERSSSDLQELRESFYADVAEYLEQLRAERDRLAKERDDPYNEEVIRVNDEIDSAQQVVESIHERRVGKVVQQASFAANGMGTVPEGLTAEERALFEDLVERIQSNRERVLDIVSGEQSTSISDSVPATDSGEDDDSDAEGDVPADDEPTEEDSNAAALMDEGVTDGGAGTASEPTGAGTQSVTPASHAEQAGDDSTSAQTPGEGGPSLDRERVRITSDVGEIYGLDERVYDLRQEDVVSLPSENAGPLIERGAAERME